MALDVRIWAVDVSEFKLWSEYSGGKEDKGLRLVRSFLSDEQDQNRVTRFVREIDQIRSLAGKLLIRLAYKQFCPHVAWTDIVVACTPEGRPYIARPKEIAFDFNITHDGDWVAIVFSAERSYASPTRVGVDVMEIHLPAFEQSVTSFVQTMDMTLTPAERRWILHAGDSQNDVVARLRSLAPRSSLNEHDQACLFRLYSLWTYKEAFTKAHGVGLSFDFAHIEVAMWHRHEADDLMHISRKSEEVPTLQQMAFCDLLLPPGRQHTKQNVVTDPGRGTGQPSLLVVAHPRSTSGQASLDTMDAEYAEKIGLLVRMSMEELIQRSQGACLS